MSLKKKILFITSAMIVGGVERALISLLEAIDKGRYDVTLLITKKGGPLEVEIPSGVRVIHLSPNIAEYDEHLLSQNRYWRWITNKAIRLGTHYFRDHWRNTYLSLKTYPMFDEPFDCVIAYKADDAMVTCVADKFTAEKKLLWVHSRLPSDRVFHSTYQKIIRRFDGVIYVSHALQDYTSSLFPTYKGVQVVIRNLVDAAGILEKADSGPVPEFPKDSVILVTVGRLSEEKGQAMIPSAVRRLLDDGHDVYWYLVGDGPLAAEIHHQIEVNDVLGRVILLGTQQNPYPYMKNCDIYVQTSLSEGWCLTTQEARLLCKPIVTTDLPVMHEQFVHNENGLITDGISVDALVRCIGSLLDDSSRRQALVETLCKQSAVNNENELYLLYDLIDD